MERELTDAQHHFAVLVAELGNQSEAYRQAYPRSKAWKAEAVHVAASKLLARTNVAVRVEALRSARRAEFEAETKRQGITPEDVIREQGFTAFANIADCFDDAGRLLPIKDMPEHMQRAVKTLKVRGLRTDGDGVEGVIVEIQLNDKLKALRDIGDHLQMYKQVHEHHWADDLKAMTEAELDAEEARVRADLEHALKQREEARRH